jgi:hypothetical protein
VFAVILLLLFGFAAPLVAVLCLVAVASSAWPLLMILVAIWVFCLVVRRLDRNS